MHRASKAKETVIQMMIAQVDYLVERIIAMGSLAPMETPRMTAALIKKNTAIPWIFSPHLGELAARLPPLVKKLMGTVTLTMTVPMI